MEKTETNTLHPAAFINQPVATPHQPRYAQQLPPGGSQGGFAARVANLATRQRMELSETLNGVSFWLLPLGFPRGEAAGLDGTSEPASPADEGWRELKD